MSQVLNPIERFALEDERNKRNRKMLRILLITLPVGYVAICVALSTFVLAGAASGTPSLGEYIPYIHWPLKLISGQW